MFSSNLRYFLYGIVLTASLGSLAVQAAGTDGIFGDYFQNMIRDAASCGTNTVITGFDTTAGSTFGTQECTPFNTLVKTVLKTFGSAPAGQAVVGYDPATGNPIFGDVNWVRSGANISYTPGRVGIGTTSPSQALDVAGNARVSGNVGIGTSSPATTLQVNGNIQAAGSPVPSNWYNIQAGSIGASTVYGYNSICTGNSSGVCNGAGGVVLSNAGSIGIGGPTESTGWGLSVHKDSWAMVTRRADGGDNAEPQNARGSIYANDMYFRSSGNWASNLASKSYVDSKVSTAGTAPCPGGAPGHWWQMSHGEMSVQEGYGQAEYGYNTTLYLCLNGSISSISFNYIEPAGTCFTKGTQVLMASGEYKAIEDIKTGEKVTGMNGSINTVRGLWRPKLGDRTLYRVNDAFNTTGDHMILAKNDKKELSWGSIEPALNSERRYMKPAIVHDSNGGKLLISNSNIDPNTIIKLDKGVSLVDYQGNTIKLNTPEKVTGTSPDTQLYTLYTDNTESFVLEGGYVVDGMPQGALPKSSNK